MNEWIGAAIAVAAGLAVGAVLAVVVRRMLGGDSRPELVKKLSDPLANLAFWIAVVVGLITALGIVNPDSLDQLPQDAVDFLPKLFAALIVFMISSHFSRRSAFPETSLPITLRYFNLASSDWSFVLCVSR